jgi:hypothetical protein
MIFQFTDKSTYVNENEKKTRFLSKPTKPNALDSIAQKIKLDFDDDSFLQG